MSIGGVTSNAFTGGTTPANDLLYDFLGVIVFIAFVAALFKWLEGGDRDDLVPVGWKSLISILPKPFLAFLIATAAFGLCAWFEIFRMFDQQWLGRIHLIGNRDTAIRLQWELAACVVFAVALTAISKFPKIAVQKDNTL